MRLLHVLTVMFFLPLSACAHTGAPFDGQVLEYGTRAPVAGAIVVARWLATWHTPWQSSTLCGHIEAATTDANGRFHIPGWTAPSLGFNVVMGGPPEYPTTVYKTGFAYYGGLDFPAYFDSLDYKQHVLFVKPFKGTRAEQIQKIWSASVICEKAETSSKNLIRLYRTLFQEASSIAETKEDHQAVDALHYQLEIMEFGYEEATKRMYEKK